MAVQYLSDTQLHIYLHDVTATTAWRQIVHSATDSWTLPVVFKSSRPYSGTPVLHPPQSPVQWYGWMRLKPGTGWSLLCRPRTVCRLPGPPFHYIRRGSSEVKGKLQVHCLWVSYHNDGMLNIASIMLWTCIPLSVCSLMCVWVL